MKNILLVTRQSANSCFYYFNRNGIHADRGNWFHKTRQIKVGRRNREGSMRVLISLTFVLSFFLPQSSMVGNASNFNEMENVQEKAFQAAQSCAKGEYLDACDDAIKYYKRSVDLLEKHEDKIFKGIREGDKSSQRILDREERLMRRMDELK